MVMLEIGKNLMPGVLCIHYSIRWFDKSISYIVTPSGRTALNFEHAWGDGVAVMRLVNDVYDENYTNPQLTPAAEGPTNLVEKVEFKLPDSVKIGIDQAKKDYEQITSSLSVNILEFKEFGKNLVKKHKLSPDAIMQLGFQVDRSLVSLHIHIVYIGCILSLVQM